VFIGIDETSARELRKWNGFSDPEAANGHLQIFEELFPLGTDYRYEFLDCNDHNGLVLRIEVAKTRDVKEVSNGTPYFRRGAQNLLITDPARLEALRRDKGLSSFESEPVNFDPAVVANSSSNGSEGSH